VKPAPSSAFARLLLVQWHLRESGGIWLCLCLAVPPWLLSSLRKRGNSTFIVARNAHESNGEPCSGPVMHKEKGEKVRPVGTISRDGMRKFKGGKRSTQTKWFPEAVKMK